MSTSSHCSFQFPGSSAIRRMIVLAFCVSRHGFDREILFFFTKKDFDQVDVVESE